MVRIWIRTIGEIQNLNCSVWRRFALHRVSFQRYPVLIAMSLHACLVISPCASVSAVYAFHVFNMPTFHIHSLLAKLFSFFISFSFDVYFFSPSLKTFPSFFFLTQNETEIMKIFPICHSFWFHTFSHSVLSYLFFHPPSPSIEIL